MSTIGNEFDLKVTEFKRNLIMPLLAKCTPAQQDLFNRMYESIEKIKDKCMRDAYCQCKRTIQNNKEK